MATGHEHTALAGMTLAFGKLPQWAQIVSILTAVFLAGGGSALAFTELTTLGPRVEQLERDDMVNDSLHNNLNMRIEFIESSSRLDRTRIEAKIDRLICLQEAQAGQHGYEQCVR